MYRMVKTKRTGRRDVGSAKNKIRQNKTQTKSNSHKSLLSDFLDVFTSPLPLSIVNKKEYSG